MTQRVIKFRAWDNKLKMMHENVECYGVYQPILPDYKELFFQDFILDKERFALLQWSGLLDKHGKEVYDKDILSLWCQADPNDYEMKAEVFWDNEQFGWFLKCYHPSGQVSIESLAEVAGEPEFIERIGDIYTTPELVDPKMIENGNS